jgi:hypothetical protein
VSFPLHTIIVVRSSFSVAQFLVQAHGLLLCGIYSGPAVYGTSVCVARVSGGLFFMARDQPCLITRLMSIRDCHRSSTCTCYCYHYTVTTTLLRTTSTIYYQHCCHYLLRLLAAASTTNTNTLITCVRGRCSANGLRSAHVFRRFVCCLGSSAGRPRFRLFYT